VLVFDEVVDDREAAHPSNSAAFEAALVELVMQLRPVV